MIDAILVYSPEQELKILANLANSGELIDWKPAIIFSAAYLEKFGIEKLKRYFERKGIKISGKLERLSLREVAILLYGLELIKTKNFSHMNRIWKERIRIVHPKGTLPAYIGEEANKKYEKIVEDTLIIIEYLKKEKKE